MNGDPKNIRRIGQKIINALAGEIATVSEISMAFDLALGSILETSLPLNRGGSEERLQ